MSFFSPRRRGEIGQADDIILNAGRIADAAMLECFTQHRAESVARQRKETEDLEPKYPGYREELNKQRRAAGLRPI